MPEVSRRTISSPTTKKGSNCRAYPPSGTANATLPMRLRDASCQESPAPLMSPLVDTSVSPGSWLMATTR
jgi:hypothetical protein